MNLQELFPEISDAQQLQFEQLIKVFLEWNSKLNLSAIREQEGVFLKHLVDSLLITHHQFIQAGDVVLDMGTGGGFPGLALAIYYPESEFILVDATQKKIHAVESMAKEVGLENVSCFAGRAEELAHNPDFREHFDVVVARAVAHFSTLLEYCLPFVRVSGQFIAYQGPDLAETWSEYQKVANTLGAELVSAVEEKLPVEDATRLFIHAKKQNPCPKSYPRAIGIPKKKPL